MRDFTKAAAASLALLAGPAALTAVSLSSSDDPGATAAARADVSAAAPHRPAANVEKASTPAAAKDAPAPAPEASDASVTTHTHSGSLGVPGMSEPELREFETQVLGPEHALEHAQMRKAERGGEMPAAAEADQDDDGPVARAAAEGPADVGAWTTAPFQIPVMAIHAALLPTGKVMWFSYPRNPSRDPAGSDVPNTAQAWLWDPATGQTKRVDPPLWRDPKDGQLKPANIWCAGQTFTKDGRLVVFGGNLDYSRAGGVDFKGLNKVYTFNAFNETWTEQPDMRHGRWYPTGVRLPDGRIPIKQGLDETGLDPGNTGDNENEEIEIFTPSPDLNGRGTMQYLASTGGSGAPPDGDYYPHMFLMPSGKTLIAGPDPGDSWLMRDPGPTNIFAWDDIPNLPGGDRVWGTGVLVPNRTPGSASTKAMLIGGSRSSSPPNGEAVGSSDVWDEAVGGGWQSGASLNIGRGHANTKLLPDGSMVEIGGGVGIDDAGNQWAANDNQRQVEVWNGSGWTLGPPQAESRAYHSTALLLPDGRVVSAGDDANGGYNTDSAEIYSPPYLFKGPRPAITSAPSCVRLGQAFGVGAVGGVSRATFVAPGATTHANDMNQRFIELSVAASGGGATVQVPGSATVAVPGYYMFFVLNAQGVPSVAKWIRVLGPQDADCPPDPVPGTPGGNPGGGSSTDETAPKVRLSRLSSAKLATVLKRGLKIGVRSSERSTVKLSLMLNGRQAKRVRLSRRPNAKQIAAKRLSFAEAGLKKVTLKLNRKAGRRLANSRLPKVKLTLNATATDKAGNSRRAKLTLSLRRGT